MGEALAIESWGRVPYAEALRRMERRVEDRRAGRVPDALFLLEHPPVVTFGRRGRPEHLRVPEAELAARGVEVHHVPRGGDVTWHGPGQLVGYLVADLAARGLADVHRYLRGIEAALGEALVELGLRAGARAGYTGVWMADADPPRKIASIGVGLRGWVSSHGFALNVTVDPGEFAAIVPCGLRGIEMTSAARELGAAAPPDLPDRAREAVAASFARWLP